MSKKHKYMARKNSISHPMSNIFTAETFEFKGDNDNAQPYILFTNCYLRDRFFYPRIRWDFMDNSLKFYTQNNKKEVRCVKISTLNCSKENETIDPSELVLFVRKCYDLFKVLLKNHKEEIMQVSFRRFDNLQNKSVCFIGETHKTYIDKNYVQDLINFFDSFKVKDGMIIDLFTEIGYHTERKNVDKLYNSSNTLSYVYTQLYKKLSDSSNVCLHKVDLRVLQCLQPLSEFQYYIEDHLEEIFDHKLNLEVLLIHVQIVTRLFQEDKIRTSFPVLYKQYVKIYKLDLLIRMFRSFFADTLKDLVSLQNMINEYIKNPKNDELKRKIYKSSILSVENSVILHSNAGFMDLYTMGRLLKPGYKYCVFFGGAYHSFEIMTTLERFGFKLKKIQGMIDFTAPYVIDMFSEKLNADIYK